MSQEDSTEAMSALLKDRPHLGQNLPHKAREEDACCSSIDCCCECNSDSCCESEDSFDYDINRSYYYQGMMWHWAKFREFMTKFYYQQQYYRCNGLSKRDVECYANNYQRENNCEREQCLVDCTECRPCQYQNTGWRKELNSRKDNLQDSLKRSWKDRSPGNINQSKDSYNEGRNAKRLKRPRKIDNFNRSPNNLNDDVRTEDKSSPESDHNAILHNKDDEDFEMELNEEFKKFLEISQKHRRERESSKLNENESTKTNDRKGSKKKENHFDVEYIDASERPLQATTSAPTFVDKTSEYGKMYGEKAEKILSLEASMQLTFDKFCDENNPKYWPNIPLKF